MPVETEARGRIAAVDGLGWKATTVATSTIAQSDDMREGVLAFFEKREPRWTVR